MALFQQSVIAKQIQSIDQKLLDKKWDEVEFADFVKKLNKSIKTVGGTALTKRDEIDLMHVFEDYKKQVLALKAEIEQTDKEIVQMVYELYGLMEEEIKIVESSIS